MTTKVVDSTVSQLLQDNSSVEYVDPKENPLATIPNESTSPRNFVETFSCDVDGKHTEIVIPEDSWDVENETVWLTQAQLAVLYGTSVPNICTHIGNIFEDEELQADSVIKDSLITASDGKSYRTKLYNLDMLLSLGYRIRSKVAIKFRQWATKHLKELMTKGRTEVGTQAQPQFALPTTYIEALEALLASEKAKLALQAERDEAIRTKTQYQSNLAAQMSGRAGGLTTALNRVKLENNRLKGDRLTKEDVYIIMNTQGVSFTLKTVKDVIRDELNIISEYLKEPFPKITTGERTDPNGKTFEVKSFVYTRKTVQAFFEFVENNPMGWQARNRKFILCEWLNHHMTIPA